MESIIIDILRILPNNVDCYIQAPSLENRIIEKIFEKEVHDAFHIIKMNLQKKEMFINQEKETLFCMYIQKIEIKKNNQLLFEGYDGVQFGILSKHVILPHWFCNKYNNENFIISEDW